eukprot:scaffold24801_cov107-Phaeocystis_antarctica.AAC.4
MAVCASARTAVRLTSALVLSAFNGTGKEQLAATSCRALCVCSPPRSLACDQVARTKSAGEPGLTKVFTSGKNQVHSRCVQFDYRSGQRARVHARLVIKECTSPTGTSSAHGPFGEWALQRMDLGIARVT